MSDAWRAHRHVRGVDRAGVVCTICRSPRGNPCRGKDGKVVDGFHPQRVAAAEAAAHVELTGAVASGTVDGNPDLRWRMRHRRGGYGADE